MFKLQQTKINILYNLKLYKKLITQSYLKFTFSIYSLTHYINKYINYLLKILYLHFKDLTINKININFKFYKIKNKKF